MIKLVFQKYIVTSTRANYAHAKISAKPGPRANESRVTIRGGEDQDPDCSEEALTKSVI